MSFASFFSKPTAVGNTVRPETLDAFPANPIDPRRAIELAQPHLVDGKFLRRANGLGSDSPHRTDYTTVTLRGDYYLVVLDSWPSYTQSFYETFPVKVHKNTGEVIPPSPSKTTFK